MKKSLLKKIACCACAAMASVVSLATFASCETSYPKAEIKVSFEGETYTLTYELARKLAPSTVRHFIELADNGFYDGLCVHDYSTSKWITGGYKQGEDGALEEIKYFDIVQSYKLTPTVWFDKEGKTPTYTVYGEFSKNDYVVTSGAWKQTLGSISMYYTDKSSIDDKVYVERYDGGGKSYKSYEYNSATSLFYFYASDSEVSTEKYCTFGRLDEDGTAEFKKLTSAIADYTSDLGDDGFTEKRSVSANTGDRWAETPYSSISVNVPKSPIVIESVKITKY